MVEISETELIKMFERVLILSKIDSSKSVAILKNKYSEPQVVSAAIASVTSIGAKFYLVELIEDGENPNLPHQFTIQDGSRVLIGNEIAKEILDHVDLVFETQEPILEDP
ncbi:hypothetical protein BS639_24615 [Rouxiella silvae]|uniref:Uncharacterized protein n=1 Tax=Rouxiella silvae TaxID=1646373 RepID=A0AA40X0C6_9GAMM|nr:hypothetical protein [Rouxiella silvae]KQN43760.1 hypothetical protein ASE93_18520 [Serratia sp. Leaf50]MBF6636144.1 hypothetical protein [Rouxiella silvae]ORJ18567.1 hypothetical protein BS639_24615 [Rouxiella silvae]